MTTTADDQLDQRPISGAVEHGVDTPPPRRARTPGMGTDNPVRISRIGSDHLRLFIRSAHGYQEILALVERLERLVDAGYDAIEVVFEAAPRDFPAENGSVARRDGLTPS